jgi:hypothetical protein
MTTKITTEHEAKSGSLLAPSGGYAAFIRRKGWHNWQESVTVIRDTPNGWRIRWETGYKTGKCATVTKRNWQIEAKPHNRSG